MQSNVKQLHESFSHEIQATSAVARVDLSMNSGDTKCHTKLFYF